VALKAGKDEAGCRAPVGSTQITLFYANMVTSHRNRTHRCPAARTGVNCFIFAALTLEVGLQEKTNRNKKKSITTSGRRALFSKTELCSKPIFQTNLFACLIK